MFKSFRGKIAFSGIAVLLMGVLLLVFTFISAYGFLTESFDIIASGDLVRTFGEALAPLIATCIRIMYLGVMGWIASLITIRGVTIIANAPKLDTVTSTPPKPATSPPKQAPSAGKPKVEPQKEKPPEPKPAEPEPPEPQIIVIPPEQVAPQQQQPPQPPQQQQPQNNNQQNPPSS